MGKHIFHFFDGVSLNDNCPGPPTAMSEHNNSLVVRTFLDFLSSSNTSVEPPKQLNGTT